MKQPKGGTLSVCFPPIADFALPFRSTDMEPLFVLLHDPPETGRVKVVGIYSSQALAEAAIQRTRILTGFVDQPDSFTIHRYDVDKDHWPRGFIRI